MRTLASALGLLGFVASAALAQTPASEPAFESANIYVRARVTGANVGMTGGVLRAGRYDLRNATMLDLITTAYGVNAESVIGGPSWLEMTRFDIVAKAPDGTPPTVLKAM